MEAIEIFMRKAENKQTTLCGSVHILFKFGSSLYKCKFRAQHRIFGKSQI